MRFLKFILWLIPSLFFAENLDEQLFLRRIADFWQEGEYQIAKSQMEEFIGEYPQSPFSDALCAALGDLFLREKNFSNALNYYSQIRSPEFLKKVFLSKMQCLYELQWYSTLVDECEAYLEKEPNLNVTYFLAISLYHQCLNTSKESEQLQVLAGKAKPYFEMLYQSELSKEISQGYAHLCCILKDYEKSTDIYLKLAEKEPKLKEEMLFQVGLIQSDYNKELALKTFENIVEMGGKKAKDAAYNKMVLAFDLGRYEDLADQSLLEQIPQDRIGTARLFLGRSLLNVKRYEEAIAELKGYIKDAPISETLYAALLSLLDASYQVADRKSLDEAIDKLNSHYPNSPELPKAYFSRAQILKREEQYDLAKKELEKLLVDFPDFAQKPQVLFELTHLGYKSKNWEQSYKRGKEFLQEFQDHDLASFTWRYVISSSAELAMQKKEHKPRLLKDLKTFLTLSLPEKTRDEFTLLYAKTLFDLKEYSRAIQSLENQNTPNAKLLLALCYRDGKKNISKFCKLAEEALSSGANLVNRGQIHASLYNAYLGEENQEKAAHHLFEAFMAKTDLDLKNILWLADHYYTQLLDDEGNFVVAARTASLLEKCKNQMQDDLLLDSTICKLAKVYSILGKIDDAIQLLEPLTFPSHEAQLLLAQNYEKKGIVDQALKIFDAIVSSSATVRNIVPATAALHSARLKISKRNQNLTEITTKLKNLVLQKNFDAEPIYLEAALDYIAITAKNDPQKKAKLFKKTMDDFSSKEDLLSKDYHLAREKSPRKNITYLGYMKFMEAERLLAEAQMDPKNQKGLKEKSNQLLLEIMEEPVAYCLKERVQKRLADET